MEIIRWGGTERQAGSRKAQLFSSMRPRSPTSSSGSRLGGGKKVVCMGVHVPPAMHKPCSAGSTGPSPSAHAETKDVVLGEPSPKSLCGMWHEQLGLQHKRGPMSRRKTPLAGRKANLLQAAEGSDHTEGFGLRFRFLPRWLLNVAAVRGAHEAPASQCTLHLLDLTPVLAVYLSSTVSAACPARLTQPAVQGFRPPHSKQ